MLSSPSDLKNERLQEAEDKASSSEASSSEVPGSLARDMLLLVASFFILEAYASPAKVLLQLTRVDWLIKV